MTIIKWKEDGVFERERSYILFGDSRDKWPQVLPKSILKHVEIAGETYTFHCPDWIIDKPFDCIDDRLDNIYGTRFEKMKKMKKCVSIEKV